jgi:hypothetical protein
LRKNPRLNHKAPSLSTNLAVVAVVNLPQF